MKDDPPTLDERHHDVPEIPSHAHPEWIMSRDGRRLVDRPRNFREWLRQEIVYFRRRRARRKTPT